MTRGWARDARAKPWPSACTTARRTRVHVARRARASTRSRRRRCGRARTRCCGRPASASPTEALDALRVVEHVADDRRRRGASRGRVVPGRAMATTRSSAGTPICTVSAKNRALRFGVGLSSRRSAMDSTSSPEQVPQHARHGLRHVLSGRGRLAHASSASCQWPCSMDCARPAGRLMTASASRISFRRRARAPRAAVRRSAPGADARVRPSSVRARRPVDSAVSFVERRPCAFGVRAGLRRVPVVVERIPATPRSPFAPTELRAVRRSMLVASAVSAVPISKLNRSAPLPETADEVGVLAAAVERGIDQNFEVGRRGAAVHVDRAHAVPVRQGRGCGAPCGALFARRRAPGPPVRRAARSRPPSSAGTARWNWRISAMSAGRSRIGRTLRAWPNVPARDQPVRWRNHSKHGAPVPTVLRRVVRTRAAGWPDSFGGGVPRSEHDAPWYRQSPRLSLSVRLNYKEPVGPRRFEPQDRALYGF